MTEIEILKSAGFKFQKRFGQNFITDTNLLNAIVSDAKITKNDFVIEVGAGAGTLTRALCDKAEKVTAFEIDKNLAPVLDGLANSRENLTVVYGDVLKQDLSKILNGEPFKLVANLPYYITTPVIFHFLEVPELQSLTVMVQKEVAERFTAKENTPAYGAVTAQLKAYGEPQLVRTVSRTLFIPQPSVDSAIVYLEINKKAGIQDFGLLKRLIAAAFAMRRKTLLNNLSAGFCLPREKAAEILKAAGLDENIRGEVLGIDRFIQLAGVLKQQLPV